MSDSKWLEPGWDYETELASLRSERMFENKVMLDGSVREPVGDNHKFGPRVSDSPADPSQQITVTAYLTDAGVADVMMSDGAYKGISSLINYCKRYNITAVPNEETKTLKLLGTIDSFQQAFDVALKDVIRSNAQYRERVGGINIPAEWVGKVTAILGLDNHPAASPRFKKIERDYEAYTLPQQDGVIRRMKAYSIEEAAAKGNTADPRVGAVPLFAAQLCKAYNFPKGIGDGTGLMIGILSLGGGYTDSDLTKFCSDRGIAKADVKWVSVDGARNLPGNDADVENALDICVIVDALAYAGLTKAKVRVFIAPNTSQGFVNAVLAASTYKEDNVSCSVVSCSWGSAEPNNTKMQMTAFDNGLVSLLKNGCAFTSASGDDGSADGTSTKAVDYPSSSPYTIGVGGTVAVLDSNGNRSSEKVWNNGPNQGAGGGGVSSVYSRPSYQSAFALPSRGVPDWSANADPSSGYRIVINGKWTSVGGTSGASPLCAALILILKSHGLAVTVGSAGLGTLHISSYANPTAFFDVTIGNNGAYPAGPSYDVASGIGVPDGTRMLSAFGLTTTNPPVSNPPPVTQPPIGNPPTNPPVNPPINPPSQPTLPGNIVGLMNALNHLLPSMGLVARSPVSSADYFSVGKK